MIQQTQLPEARWDILRTIHVGGHLGATERMLQEVLLANYLAVTRTTVRDQLHYLQARKLIEVARSEIEPWTVTLTRYGYDVVEYQVECDPGIRRPPRLNRN